MSFRKDYLPDLDGIRALAVMMVLWVHMPRQTFGNLVGDWGYDYLLGILGVDLFFVLSGFLITRILLVDRELGVPLRYFWYRRFLRIFPVYYLLLALLAYRLSWQEILTCATYTSNYGFLAIDKPSILAHTWSLAVEEHFYLVWPPIAMLLIPRKSRKVLLAVFLPLSLLTIVAIFFFANWESNVNGVYDLLIRGSTTRFGSLALGALIAYHEDWVRSARWTVFALIAAAIGLAGALSDGFLQYWHISWWVNDFGVEAGPGRYHRFMHCARLIMVPCVSFSLVMLTIATAKWRTPWGLLLRSHPARWIGRISYGLYLYHFPIYHFVKHSAENPRDPGDRLVLIGVALSFVAATVSFYCIERPIMGYSKRFRVAAPPVPTTPNQ